MFRLLFAPLWSFQKIDEIDVHSTSPNSGPSKIDLYWSHYWIVCKQEIIVQRFLLEESGIWAQQCLLEFLRNGSEDEEGSGYEDDEESDYDENEDLE